MRTECFAAQQTVIPCQPSEGRQGPLRGFMWAFPERLGVVG